MRAVLAVTSAKHSPGVTTAALAFSLAAGPVPVSLVVEADPAGGDLAARCERPLEPGLGTLTAAGRHGVDVDLSAHVQELPGRAFGLLAPASPAQVTGALDTLGTRLVDALQAWEGTVVVDCGRWQPDGPAAALTSGADALVVVLRPSVDGVEHVRARLDQFRTAGAGIVAAIVVGTKPYPPAEIEAALGVPVLGTLPFDPRGARALEGRGLTVDSTRSSIVRAARSALDALARTEPARAEAWA